MAMDFWEAQRQARKKTVKCLIAFVLLTFGVAALAEIAMRVLAQDQYDTSFPLIGFIFLVMIFCVAGFQYLMYKSYGGKYAAESVGAYKVDSSNCDPQERQVLNILQEMSLAASLPTPPLYIIPAREINAFAAGLTPEDTVVAITEGALDKLNRDELQGVIAHELGHVNNADMRISLQLAAMIMGFFFMMYMGFRVLQFSSFRSRSNRKGPDPIALAALILMVAGVFTWFAGGILKAMISRQREYLADASSVQFTRNPEGIAGALRKIAKDQDIDMPKEGMAISHMYFNDHSFWSQLFATHPPLEKRIAAIEGKEIE